MKTARIIKATLLVAVTLRFIQPATAENTTTNRIQQAGKPTPPTPVVAGLFTPVPMGQVRLTGLLGKYVDTVPTRVTKQQGEEYLSVFEHPADTNGWRAEHMGKWLEAACNTMIYRHDAKMHATVDVIVARLLQLQQPDGWLGSYAPPYRFQNYDWNKNQGMKYDPFWNGPFYDLWCHYLTMGGLIRYHQTTGNRQALEAAENIAHLIIATFGPGRQDLMLVNHDHGFGPGVGVFPMSKLYLETGDVRYRDFARYIVSQYGRKGKVPIVLKPVVDGQYPFPDREQIKHCEFEFCLAGMCQLYRATGELDLLATCRDIYDGYYAPQMQTMCVHGFKSPQAGIRVPDTYYGFLETCDIVPMQRWFSKMGRITGNVKYFDDIEWNLYNALLSRDLQHGRVWPGISPPTDDHFNCCYSMLSVGLSSIPQWVYFTTTNGIMVNLYESSVVKTRIARVPVTVEQLTEYPLAGTVSFKIEPQRAVAFDLLLRIPEWCKAARVRVNGRPLGRAKPAAGKFLKIREDWMPSSTVTIVFDLPGRITHHKYARNPEDPVITLERGPLLLALSQKLNPGVNLETVHPMVGRQDAIRLKPMAELIAVKADTFRFQAEATDDGAPDKNGKPRRKLIFLTPYAFSGGSEKAVPPVQNGVFDPYSEDGAGKAIRVEFSE